MTGLKVSLTLAVALLLLGLFAIFALVYSPIGLSALSADNRHAPCSFSDTVDLTGYTKFPNGSYLYEGLIVPPQMIGIYEYNTTDLSQRVPVEPHPRGCICKLRPCVNVCCPLTMYISTSGTHCEGGQSNDTLPMITLMNITNRRGEMTEVDITKKFSIQFQIPCADMFLLKPFSEAHEKFNFFENGTLLVGPTRIFYPKNSFCLIEYYEPDLNIDEVLPYVCSLENEDKSKTKVNAYMMLFSVPFLILTIIVYLAIPELRTLHGKTLCCYLLGLCIGYSILSAIILLPKEYRYCMILGYIAYYFFMASFLWLSVISFDLFSNISAPRGRYNEKKRFIFYSIYTWGLAFVFLCLTFAAQNFSFFPDEWKPQIGTYEWCWLNAKTGWSAMAYFYGPIIIIIGFNIIMFILTALKIYEVQNEMSRIMQSSDSKKNLCKEEDKFVIFLRLFIIMGVTWLMEIASYTIGDVSPWNKFFFITDICNGIQGFIIFTLFVLKKKVKQYIIRRYKVLTGSLERNSQYSTKTLSSSCTIQSNGNRN